MWITRGVAATKTKKRRWRKEKYVVLSLRKNFTSFSSLLPSFTRSLSLSVCVSTLVHFVLLRSHNFCDFSSQSSLSLFVSIILFRYMCQWVCVGYLSLFCPYFYTVSECCWAQNCLLVCFDASVCVCDMNLYCVAHTFDNSTKSTKFYQRIPLVSIEVKFSSGKPKLRFRFGQMPIFKIVRSKWNDSWKFLIFSFDFSLGFNCSCVSDEVSNFSMIRNFGINWNLFFLCIELLKTFR